MAIDTERRATEREIATARAWVDHIMPRLAVRPSPDDLGGQAAAYYDSLEAGDQYRYALEIVMFASDWTPPVVVTDLRCGCHAHLSHWGDSGSTVLRRQCGSRADAYHKDDSTLPVCAHCADCDAELSKGFHR